jgi:hypothetical protein
VRDIEAHLQEIYGVKVGRDLISRVTDGVIDDVRACLRRCGCLTLIARDWWLRLVVGKTCGLFGEEAVAVDYGGGEVDEFAVVDS